MKKLLGIVLALIFVLSLSACTNKSGGSDNQSEASNPQQTASEVTSSVVTDSSKPTQSKPSINASDAKISKEKVIEIALKKVSKKQSEVYDIEAELDIENGVLVWEVEFEDGKFEYDFEIDAKTGAIVKQQNGKD